MTDADAKKMAGLERQLKALRDEAISNICRHWGKAPLGASDADLIGELDRLLTSMKLENVQIEARLREVNRQNAALKQENEALKGKTVGDQEADQEAMGVNWYEEYQSLRYAIQDTEKYATGENGDRLCAKARLGAIRDEIENLHEIIDSISNDYEPIKARLKAVEEKYGPLETAVRVAEKSLINDKPELTCVEVVQELAKEVVEYRAALDKIQKSIKFPNTAPATIAFGVERICKSVEDACIGLEIPYHPYGYSTTINHITAAARMWKRDAGASPSTEYLNAISRIQKAIGWSSKQPMVLASGVETIIASLKLLCETVGIEHLPSANAMTLDRIGRKFTDLREAAQGGLAVQKTTEELGGKLSKRFEKCINDLLALRDALDLLSPQQEKANAD